MKPLRSFPGIHIQAGSAGNCLATTAGIAIACNSQQGLQIESGPIESAHKDALQQGLQQMVHLRTAYKVETNPELNNSHEKPLNETEICRAPVIGLLSLIIRLYWEMNESRLGSFNKMLKNINYQSN